MKYIKSMMKFLFTRDGLSMGVNNSIPIGYYLILNAIFTALLIKFIS